MTPSPISEVTRRLEEEAAKLERDAQHHVQGPAFKGSEWGADIIARELQFASDLRAILAYVETLEATLAGALDEERERQALKGTKT
jgi:hypothetical protein